MPFHVILAAAAVSTAVPVLWWAMASARQPASGAVARNLAGTLRVTDLRQAVLQRSARERAVEPAVAALANRARRLTPAGMVDQLERRLVLAGVGHWGIDRTLAAKLGLGVTGAVVGGLAWVANPTLLSLLMFVLLTGIGWFGIDVVLSHKAAERQEAIERELPDTLDQITISVEAGLGFEAALARVGQTGTGPLAAEIAHTLQDIQLGVPRKEALQRLVGRTEVADLRRFVHAVTQAEAYGVPIAQVLRVQASELREKRRQRAEERALKIPVKIVFPLILCILPALFVVIIGPAALNILDAVVAD
ncbi:MAG TPA: type II secretion system F family protein [Acidimicrobiia bacterium]|nr:type II secretion system F family protein [Acidimicrobiia bacterium]